MPAASASSTSSRIGSSDRRGRLGRGLGRGGGRSGRQLGGFGACGFCGGLGGGGFVTGRLCGALGGGGLLAGGGVFWAAGEPIAHYLATPPVFGDLSGDPAAQARAAMRTPMSSRWRC